MATVKIIKEVEIDESIGSDAITGILTSYPVCNESEGVGTISYYNLDEENKIRFLEALQEQLWEEIQERIDLLRSRLGSPLEGMRKRAALSIL